MMNADRPDPTDRILEKAASREIELRRRIDEAAHDVRSLLVPSRSVRLALLFDKGVAQAQCSIRKALGRVGGGC